MYNVYTVLILLLINTFTLTQLMDIILTVDNADDFTENFYVTLAMLVSCCKMFSLLRNRNNIEMLIDILMKKPCRPTEHDEIEIRQKFDKLVQTNTLYYETLVELTCAFALAASVFKDYRKHKLAFRAWLPFNYSSPMLFRIAYAHQSISLTAGSLEIVECHLKKIVDKPYFLQECVVQHICIFKFALMMNEKFRSIITIQFLVSMLVVCFNLYQLTQTSALSAKYIQIILYMFCMLIQISFFAGTEMNQQLVSDMFETEWYTLDCNMQKSLSLIMTCSSVPIEFTSAYVIPMNLESFVNLLKTSYSAYNILQQICGCWIPDSWTSPYKRAVYYAYTTFIFLLINTFTLSQFLDLILIVDNADDFIDNFYILLAMIISCSKMFSLLINRNNIVLLTEILTKNPCKPVEDDELEIRQKFDKIIEFALFVNKKFRLIITLQFIVSTLVVCVVLYELTKANAKIIQLGLYMSCMLTQIFLYCWYGHEVRLKSLKVINDIFEIEWLQLEPDVRKDLLMLTKCGSVPIEFTSAYIIPMNLDSFVALLKTSYSVFNILQQMRDTKQTLITLIIITRKLKMQILDFTFKILMICGCWIPNSWTTPYKRLVYHVYTIFIMLLIHTFMLSQLMDLILIVDNADDFTDNFYMLLAMIVSCCKMFTLLMNRNNIAMLIDILVKKPCRPVQSDEIEIQQKFDKLIQTNTLYYAILVETTCVCIAVTSLLTEFSKRRLTFRAWLPFNYSSSSLFYIVYVHQLIGLTAGSVLHVACDGLICGLLVHVCCQIEIIECRLRKVANNQNSLNESILQHNYIFNFAWLVNEKFRITIVIQFIVSTLVVCFNLYQFTKSITKYMQLIMYMGCMLSQIFFYCWYGNEVKLKSRQLIDNIFKMKWYMMDQNVKKALLLIMKRSIMPIEFTSAYIVSMNLDSFVGILKTSYSTYNLLQQIK
ncbi:hypothetical protein P5V15_000890 [Pogonomyrmex californicus]